MVFLPPIHRKNGEGEVKLQWQSYLSQSIEYPETIPIKFGFQISRWCIQDVYGFKDVEPGF
jgi:hypothetical protein